MPSGDLFIGNDNTVELRGLVNNATGSPVSNASVSMELLDENDEQPAGQLFPQAMAAQGNGRYTATLQDTLALRAGRNYRVVITANAGGGLVARFVRLMRARERKF